MIIDYNATKTFSDSLVIDDAGNCAIYCFGSFRDGKISFPGEYYLLTNTVMGKTTIIKWGPLMPDQTFLPNTFKLEVKVINYKEPAIEREITSFINDGFKGVEQATVISIEEAMEKIPGVENIVETLD